MKNNCRVDLKLEKEAYSKSNGKDPIAFIAKNINDVIVNVSEKIYNTRNVTEDETKVWLNDISSILINEVLNKLDFFSDKEFKRYNEKFDNVYRYNDNSYKNPFTLTYEKLYEFYENFNEQSIIELYLRNMYFFNQIGHITDSFIDRSVYSSIERRKIKNKDLGKEYNISTNEYKRFLSNINIKSGTFIDKNGLKINLANEYINLYNDYLLSNITFDELKENNISKEIINIAKSNNKKNMPVNYTDIYNYFLCENIKRECFSLKSMFLEKACIEYSKLGDKEEKDNYRITKRIDKSQWKNNSFNIIIDFDIKGYNSPYSVHERENSIIDIEKKMGNEIEHIEDEGVISNNSAYLYKYTVDEINAIRKIHENIKEGKFLRYYSEDSGLKVTIEKICNRSYLNEKSLDKGILI